MTNEAVSFNGPAAVNVFAMKVLASGLRLYAKTGMKPNRMYTPKAMLETATKYTGKAYKRGQYEQAAQDLTELAATSAQNLPEGNSIIRG